MQIIFANLIFILFVSYGGVQAGNWQLSCKACVEVMVSCDFCRNPDECLECAANLSNTQCYNCMNDIFYGSVVPFFCSNTIKYHQLACGYYCKSSDSFGQCDSSSGECLCYTSPLSTVATSSTSMPTTEHITTEHITTEPIITEHITTEPITTEPITTEPITTEPITTESTTTTSTTTSTITSITTEPTTTTTSTDSTTKILTTAIPWNAELWKTSCIPCNDILDECSQCLKDECYKW